MTSTTKTSVLELPNVFWNLILALVNQFAFWGATLYLLFASLWRPEDSKEIVVAAAIAYAFGFLSFVASRIVVRKGYKKLKALIIEWASEVYGVTLNPDEAATLTRPVYPHFFKHNFFSQPVRQWTKNSQGRQELSTFQIVVVEGSPLLYRHEISGGSPHR